MFNYSEKTKVNLNFKMQELFKTIKADKEVKTCAKNVLSVVLANIISPERTNLEANNNVKEIYVFDIDLNTNEVPTKFLDCLNKSINFQTLFKLHFNFQTKYLVSLKVFSEEKMSVLKTFESEWKKQEKIAFPVTTKLEIVFNEMLKYVVGYSFKPEETFQGFVQRLDRIKKLKAEIEKLTKTMNAEKQPNFKMAMNDKIKEIKKELQMLEG